MYEKEAEEKLAACALCVGVGSFSDPVDIPGLAHFVEHMVFMGSEKYPQENGFDEFIKVFKSIIFLVFVFFWITIPLCEIF